MPNDKQHVDPESAETLAGHHLKKPLVRRIVVALVFAAVCFGIVFGTGTGTISSFGWESIASICPLGALETMVAAKTLIPQGVVFFLVVAAVLVIFGKFFCSWICPVPSVRSFIDTILRRQPTLTAETAEKENGGKTVTLQAIKPLSRRELRALQKALPQKIAEPGEEARPLSDGTETAALAAHCGKTCGGCEQKARETFDSRHLILGGSLLSAAIFGFPVFCLICPIGLTFASVVVVVQLFGNQTLSWSLLLFPLILILELTVLRTWCLKFCPMGALASLLSIPNRLFRPKVDEGKCLRSKGVDCRICSSICPENLDPHTMKSMNECSKCRDCAANCPVGAISFPLLHGSGGSKETDALKET